MARPTHVLECAFTTNPDDPVASQVWADITPYLDVRKGVRMSVGRTDEFAAVQPSKLDLTLNNRDGRFTPENTASPYYPNVISGKRIRYGLGWPGNGKQLDSDPSFNGAVPFAGSSPYGWESKPGFPTTTITATATFAQSGSNSMLLTLPTATATNGIVRKFVYGLVAGRQYTASVWIRVPTGSPVMNFGCSPGGVVSTTLTNTFELKSITFTATGPYCELYIYTNAASTAGQLVQVDSVQVEAGAAVTTFESTAGVFNWRFTGDVDGWPLTWEGGPAQYAESSVTATDRLKKLGDLGEFQTFLKEDVLDDLPIAYYPLGEAAASVSVGDISGNNQPPLTIRQVGTGGSIVLGSNKTASGADTVPPYYAGKETSVGFNAVDNNNGKYLRALLKTPTSPAATGASVAVWAIESVSPLVTGPLGVLNAADGSWFGVTKAASGNITAEFFNASTGVLSTVVSGVGLPSGQAFLLSAVLDIPSAGNGRITFMEGGGSVGSPVVFPMAAVPSWRELSVGGRAKQLFRGNLTHAAFYDYPVSASAFFVQSVVGSQGKGLDSDTTQFRMQKLLQFRRMAGGGGEVFVTTGTAGPKNIGPQEIEGDPLSAIRLVEATEDGVFYIDGAGSSRFALRSARLNLASSLVLQASRLDPGALTFRGDDFGLVNDVTAQRSDGATARVVNETSRAASGRRKSSIDTLAATDDDLTVLAAWEANTYGVQRNRLSGVKISLLNDGVVLLPTALLVGIGSKLLVNVLPSQAPASSKTVFVEGWDEVVSEDEWSMTFNTSPGEVGDVWQIGVAGHNEIGLTTRIPY